MCHAQKKSRKIEITEGVEQPNQKRLGTPEEKEKCKYLGILEADIIKKVEMKEEIKRVPRQMRKLLETKLYKRNLIKRITKN